jgi:glycosyltransferase involved in cell wall biosynthesis
VKVRVLLVPEAFPPSPGGIAVTAARIVAFLRQVGLEVWVVDFDCRGDFSPGLSVTIDPSRENTILVTPFFDNQAPVRIPERVKAAARQQATLQLTTLARSLGIHLVHSLSVFNAGFVATFVAGALQVPHIVGVRGFGRHPFDGFRAECVRWVLERASAVVIANRSLLELLSVAHPTQAASATIVQDAVTALPYPGLESADRYALRAEARAAPEDVLITLGANLRERTLLGLVLQALASVPDRPATRLLILGRVHPGVRDQFDADIRRLGLDDRVMVREAPPPEVIPQWLEASDIVVMPSVDYGTTNIVLEAMERARCVVASEIFAEVVRHEENGMLVNRLDPARLGETLASLASDPEKRNRLGTAARALVLADFRPEREASAYVSLYERLLAA